MKTYSLAPDVEPVIRNVIYEHHGELIGVRVGSLFVFDDDSAGEPVLTHQGYPAQAMVKITPLRDRTLGVADAVIVADRATWLTLSQPQRNALVDHELTHLARVLDKESGKPKFDALGRPKLRIRPHDHQLGWFVEVAQRHGAASPEMRQAKQLMEGSGQQYFDFRWAMPAPQISTGELTTPSMDPNMLIWWQNGETGECWSGKRSEMPSGCVEIDPPAGGESERQQMAADQPEAA